MTKEKVQLAVIAIGIIFFIALTAGNLKKKPGKTPNQEPAPAQKTSADSEPAKKLTAPANADTREEKLELQKEREKLEWGRDPFSVSKSAKEYQRAALQLKGISLGKNKIGFAFINNEIVKKGDIIGDYEVTQIQKDKVLLRKGEQSFYLTLPQE
jgi:hypothetical protein